MAINLGNMTNSNSSGGSGLTLNKKVATTIAPVVKKKKKETALDVIGNVAETSGKTLLAGANYLGQGTLKAGEQVLDTALQIGSSKYNPYYMLHPEELASAQATTKELVSKDATQNLITKLSGEENFNKNVLDKGSLIKSTNLGGKLLTGVGQILPSVATGSLAAGTGVSALTGYGSGIETAYQGGANREKANLYGAGSSALNAATEMITGGIPGVKSKFLSGLDKLVAKGLGKETLNEASKTVSKALLQAGYKAVGEGGEEAISAILDPYLKNITYDKNAKIDWQNVIDNAVQGALIGGVLNAPGTISDVKQATATKNKPNLPVISPIEKQTIQTDTNISTTQNKPLETNIQSIDKNVIINEKIEKNTKSEPSKEIKLYRGGTNDNIYMSTDKNVATDFAKNRGGDVKEFVLKENSKIIDYKDIPNVKYKNINDYNIENYSEGKTPLEFMDKNLEEDYSKATEWAKQNGYDAVKFPTEGEIRLINKDIVKENVSNIETEQPIENIPFNEQTGEVTQQQEVTPSKFTKTAMSSKIVTPEVKKYLKETFGNEQASYVPLDDKTAIENADRTIKTSGYENSKTTFNTKINNGERLTKNDIVLGEKLIQEAIDRQDFDTAGELINNVAIAGSELGQAVQALSVIKKMTPQGQLKMLDTIINRENNSNKNLQKKGVEIKLSKEARNKILSAKDNKQLETAATEAVAELSKQVPPTLENSLRSWRYLAMLGNPKTHIRNIVSNLAMKSVSKVKNTQATILENIINPKERTKTFGKVSKDIKDFVKKDAIEMRDRIQGQDKYDLKSQFNLDKKSFTDKTLVGKTLNKFAEFNSNLLGIEDWMFSSSAYKESMANYMKANNLNSESDPKSIEKARVYAINQAREQTFTQFNEFANRISQFEKNNKVANLAVGAILPFKKTPLNIAKAGVEYSPIGLAKTLTKGIIDLKNKKISSTQFIDDISKGFTGSEILVLGGILASMGLLRGSGSKEDKEEALQKGQGYQPYSLQIGNKSITLDWLSPAAMPLFTGVEFYELSKEDSNFDLATTFEAISTTLDPLTSMSMLQGVNNTIASYDMNSPLGSIGAVGINALQNYALQFFPTVGGQIARTMDDTRRSTTGSGTGIEKKVNTFVNKVKAKIPGLENTLEPYTDYFGREQVEKDINTRIFSNFISPAYINTIKTTPAEEEIQKLFTNTGETSILPTSSNRNFTVDGVKYNINSEDYTKFNKQDGGKALEILNKVVKTDSYKNLTDEQKVKLIDDTYKYTMSLAKETYSKEKKIPYSLPKSMAALKSLEEKGTDAGTYLANKSYIDSITKDGADKKSEVVNHLIKQNLNDDELEALYKTAGYNTDLSAIRKANIPLKEYLKIEAQDIKDTTNTTGTKIITSRKKNYISAVNKLNLSAIQKALLIKSEYSSYDNYNEQIVNYVNKLNMTQNEKNTYLINLGFKVKNGKVS